MKIVEIFKKYKLRTRWFRDGLHSCEICAYLLEMFHLKSEIVERCQLLVSEKRNHSCELERNDKRIDLVFSGTSASYLH